MRLRLHTALVVSCLVSACSPDAEPSGGSQIELVQAPSDVTPGVPTAQVLIVRVLDDMGQSTQGVPVRWEAAPGSGSLEQSADTSGVDGLASALWTPGLSLEEQQVSVTIYDQPAFRILVRAAAFHADKIGAYYRDGCGLAGTAVWCWAHSSFYGPTATIARVLPQLGVVDIAVSSGYVCALDASGTTYCHSNFDASPPESYVTPAGLPPIRAISGGGSMFCGIAIADGTPWCWSQSDLAPVQVSASLQLSSVSAGSGRSCGLTGTGAAWCWEPPAGSPVAVTGGHTFRTISAAGSPTCAIEAPTVLYCWAGIGGTPAPMPGVSATQVSMGVFGENLVNTSSGPMIFYANLSDPDPFFIETSSALPVPSRAIADHCALAFDGTVYCTSPYTYAYTNPFTWAAIPAPVQ